MKVILESLLIWIPEHFIKNGFLNSIPSVKLYINETKNKQNSNYWQRDAYSLV